MKKVIFIFMAIILMVALVACKETEEEQVEEIFYTVEFFNKDGVRYSSSTVLEGTNLENEIPPKYEGYTFVGWDKDITNIQSDMQVRALYTKDPIYHLVRFLVDGKVVKEERVEEGKPATAPDDPIKDGYRFIGWDKTFVRIYSNLDVEAMFKKNYEVKHEYVSYVENLIFMPRNSTEELLKKIDLNKDLSISLSNVFNGGYRGTNQLHYYDNANMQSRNTYGFEVAVNEKNVVVNRAALVDLPEGGFILSGHGSAGEKLSNSVKIGDIIFMSEDKNTANIYRNASITNLLELDIELSILQPLIENANSSLVALDYKSIISKYNMVVQIFNLPVYNFNSIQEARKLLLDIRFHLVEGTSVGVRAMWHYPLRSGFNGEANEHQVIDFLEKVKRQGFNRIYLNTNFGGRSVYKSEYLHQALSSNNSYGEYEDYLQCFIEEAHKRGIEVFAWTNTLIAGDGSNNPTYSSKGWVQKGYNGEDNHNGMYFVDIGNDEVQDFLNNVFYELANKYNLDGIEFDFIRYASGNLHTFSGVISDTSKIIDWGYTDAFMSKFMNAKQYNGNLKELIKNDPNVRGEFLDFKMNLLTETVERLTTTIRSARSGIKISAAVMPSITTAKNTYLQDWKTWIERGYIDILEPMIYTADNNYLIDTINNMLIVVGKNAEVVVGIFPENIGGSTSMNSEQIILLESLNIAGWSKFSSKTIFNNSNFEKSLDSLGRDYTVSTLSSKEEKFNAYLIDQYDKLKNYYQYRVSEPKIQELISYIENIINDENVNINSAYDEINSIINTIQNNILKSKLLKDLNKINL